MSLPRVTPKTSLWVALDYLRRHPSGLCTHKLLQSAAELVAASFAILLQESHVRIVLSLANRHRQACLRVIPMTDDKEACRILPGVLTFFWGTA